MGIIKKISLGIFVFLAIGTTLAAAPSFDNNFAKYLTDATPDAYGRVETVFTLCVDRNLTLMENIKNLFYPSTIANSTCGGQWGQLWGVIRVLAFVIMVVFLILAGVQFIMKAKEADGQKKAVSSLLHIAYGAFLIFGVIWILWTVLNIWAVQWTTQVVDRIQNTLFLQILSFFKVLGFFLAIIMMVVYGVRMMAAMDKDDKLKLARTWILNVVIALVLIKIIDYVFYIAQAPDLASKASGLIINVAIMMGRVLWALFVWAIFYAGFLMLTSSGDETTTKKATGMIVNILLVALVVFLFLLIVYQIFNEFA